MIIHKTQYTKKRYVNGTHCYILINQCREGRGSVREIPRETFIFLILADNTNSLLSFRVI